MVKYQAPGRHNYYVIETQHSGDAPCHLLLDR
jgi:hypothetical protein